MSLKDVRKLPQKQLKDIALLCAGAALLLLVSVFVGRGGLPSSNPSLLSNSGASQAAATVLGDAQGVPPSYTGDTYPANTLCYINWSYASYGGNPLPTCPSIGYSSWGQIVGQTDTFSTGVFSVDLGSNVGQSAYQTRTVTLVQPAGPYLGQVTTYCAGVLTAGKGGSVCSPNAKSGATWVVGCNYTIPSGYTRQAASGSSCYAYNAPYFSLGSPSGSSYSGTAPTVGAGQSMTMEWSCLPSRTVYGTYHTTSNNFFGGAGGWGGQLLYNIGLASSVTGSGSGFSPSGLTGTQTITAPSTPGTYNYSLTCNGATNAMTISITVIALPTTSITGNGTNPVTAIVGQPVTILASFGVAGSDTLSKTAINDYLGNLWCGTGNTCSTPAMWTAAPLGTKTYTFTPASVGAYLFTPSMQSASFPSWNNYNASLTVNVVAQCPNGSGPTGSCTACNSGYALQGTAPSNSCVAQCPNGSGPTGSCTACNAGYVLQGTAPTNICAAQCPANCPGATGAPNCTANSGFTYNSGPNTCTVYVPPPSVTTFSSSLTRVRKSTSTSVTFTYLVTHPPASCTISGPAGFTPLTISPVDGVTGTQTATVNLSQISKFTLTCGVVTVQTSIGLVPNFQEI